MSLTREQELNRIVRVVDDFVETVEVREQQVRTFVGRKTTTETDNQVVRIHLTQRLNDTTRVTLGLHPVLKELLLDIVHHLAFQAHTRSPNLAVRNVCVRPPHIEVRLVVHPSFGQVFVVHIFPVRGSPCRHVNAVRHIVHVQFFGEITRPYRREHFLRNLAVQPAHAVGLLAGIQREYGHRELLVVVLRIRTTHTNQVMPLDA